MNSKNEIDKDDDEMMKLSKQELNVDLVHFLEKAQQTNLNVSSKEYRMSLLLEKDDEKIKKKKSAFVEERQKSAMIAIKVDQLDHQAIQTKRKLGIKGQLSSSSEEDEIPMQLISNKEDDKQGEEKLIEDAASALPTLQCRLCKSEHWTTKCPYQDNLQPIMDQTNEKQNENVSSTMNNAPFQDENTASGETGETSSKLYSVSAHRVGVGTADFNEQETTHGSAYSSHASDMRKQDETTVRLTNLPEEIEEEDLYDVFIRFGPVNQVVLVKDETNNVSKGSAFITFNDKKDAQKVIESASEFGYDRFILKAE